MAHGSTTTSANPPRASTETKSKKKKASSSKTLEPPAAEASKTLSGRNSANSNHDEGHEGSAEKEHIREVQK